MGREQGEHKPGTSTSASPSTSCELGLPIPQPRVNSTVSTHYLNTSSSDTPCDTPPHVVFHNHSCFQDPGNCQECTQLIILLPLNWLFIIFSVRIPAQCGRSCFGLFHGFRASVWASVCGRNLLAVEWIIVCSIEDD